MRITYTRTMPETVLSATPTTADAGASADGESTFRLYLSDDRNNLDCRFYENKYPEIEEIVMVNVRNIADMGAYVSLLEYNNIEGMILLSELSRRRIRSINKLIRVHRNEVVMVLRVDKEKGYIDLSKRRVSPEDIAKCEDRYNKAKAVHGVLRHLAEVMVNVRNIADMGAYVSLLEYNNIEGMILLSELSRRRIRSINKLIRVHRNEVVMVLRVDKEKGYIDLSKRRVSPEDIAKCEDRYNKAKAVHGVLRHLAERRKLYLEDLYERIGWPLYKKYGHAYDAFKLALADEAIGGATDRDDPFAELDMPTDMLDELKAYIRRRLAPQPIKVRADVEVSCFTYEGIDAIRDALFAGMALGTEQSPIKVKLIAPPIYVLSTTTLDKGAGIALLTKAIETIESTIQSKGGKLDVKMAPKAVSVKEEAELQAMMDRIAMENEEVDGDAPEDE